VRFCFVRLVFSLFCIFSFSKSLFIFLKFHVGCVFRRSLPQRRSTISASAPPSTDDEETLSQCGEAQVSVTGNDRNEIPNVDAAMLLTQCSDPGEAVLVAQCSGGHVAQTTCGVPGDDSIRHAFLTDESEALLNFASVCE